MSVAFRQSSAARAGRLACLCGPETDEPVESGRTANLTLLSAGFACAVLAQALALGTLPLAGQLYAPSPLLATLPFAAFFVGAACASLPASMLLDAFGRRAGFALGASLGCAGGLLLAWSMTHGQFHAFLLGSFWLGVANGFGLFYRHAAAGLGARHRRSALAILLGAGTVAGLLAPSLAGWAEGLSPQLFVGTALLASATHIGALALALALPARRERFVENTEPYPVRAAVVPTAVGAAAWFAMTALMGASPIAMAGCGVDGTTITGAVAWHVVAMYAPALFVGALPDRVGTRSILVLGASLLVLAALFYAFGNSAVPLTAGLVCLGAGWSLVTLAATFLLHEPGAPSRWVLGLHDAVLFSSAILGALAAGVMAL